MCVGKLTSRRIADAKGLLKFGGVVSNGVMLSEWNEFGGMVRRLGFWLRGISGPPSSDKSRFGLLVACTSGLVGARIIKLEDRLLPKDGALRLLMKLVLS